MADFSQQEMLILSNFVYFNCSTDTNYNKVGDIINSFKNEDGSFDVSKLRAEGGISLNVSEEEALNLFERIDKDERLKELHVARKLEEEDVRGVLFSNEDGSDACLVFRGTGGTYDAWYDNVRGEYETDTKIQKIAADFVKYECADFNNISVTGHSKGGNLAQYVTVLCSSQISNCVSFDGQGFSKEFIQKYDDKIKASKDKITSVCAYNDYVNILLTPIAGSRIFLKNEGTAVDGHSSATLLNSITFNSDGSIDLKNSKVCQGPLARMLEETTDNMVNIIDLLPKDGNKAVSEIIATAVAAMMSYDKTDEFKESQYRNALKSFGSYSANMMDLISSDSEDVIIQFQRSTLTSESMKYAYETMYESSTKLMTVIERTEEIYRNLSFVIAGRYFAEKKLEKVVEKMGLCRRKLYNNASILRNVSTIYEKDEEELLLKLSTRAYSIS